MIVNYDKEAGWTSAFSGLFTGLTKNDKLFVERMKVLKDLPDGEFYTQPIENYSKALGDVNQELVNSAKAVQSGKQSWDDFDATVTKVTKSSSKFSSFISNAGSALKSFGASVLNMGANMIAGMAIGAAISGVITLIDDYIHRNEKLIEAGEEAKSSIEESFNAFSDSKSSIIDLGKSLSSNTDDIKTTGDAIDSLAKKYTELREGVSWSDNSNKFLTDEDYQSYLDISNQIAAQFPSLVAGYDAQGNAILNLGNNAATAASQLTDLYNASMLSANVDIGNQLNDRYAGVEAQIKEYQSEIYAWQSEIKNNDENISAITIEPTDITNGIIEFDPNAFGDETAKVRKEINDILNKHGITNREDILEDGTIQINTSGISSKAAEEISSVMQKYGEDAVNAMNIENADFERQIAANQQLIQDQWDSMADSIGQYIQTSSAFTELDSTLQNAFLGNIREIDASVIGEKYDGDVQQFIYSEILNPLSSMKPEAQQALADLIQLDPSNMNIDEYSDLISKALYNAFPNDSELQSQMKKTFGFDKAIEEAERQANALKNALGDNFSSAIDSMSLDELEKGYDIVINGDEAITTVDELNEKIEQAQALAATAVDLDVHTNMDAIASALESANAGADYENAVSYLKQAKDLFDKGLVGTDDFKSIAAYLSPTGSDDPVNFMENYSKAARYLTEDASGVQNFLNDLESHDFANLETLSDGTKKWTYDIEDLEQAASDMGIGFEFMMDMFGRLEDYGFSNNFVGSVEDGAQQLNDLYTQLAQEEAKLAQLQAEGADTTAIEQQQEKVNSLKNDITETKDAMQQLVAASADDYAEQVATAKETLSTLAEERKKILEDNTYGEDTQTVADLMENQMREIATENGLELDAELNVVNTDEALDIGELDFDIDLSKTDDLKDAAQEYVSSVQDMVSQISDVEIDLDSDSLYDIDSQINAVQEVLYSLRNEDGTINIDTPGAQEAISVLDALYAQKQAVSGAVIMSVDTSGLDADVGAVITKLQEFQQAYNELERLNTLASVGLSVDTSDAQANLDTIVSQIQGLDGEQAEIMAKIVPDTSSVESIQASISGLTESSLNAAVGVQVTGKDDVESLKTSINNVPKSTNATVSAMTYGKANVDDLASSIANVQSKSVTITATTVKKTVNEDSKASGTMLTPARVSGTAYNVLNLKPAYANGNVALTSDEEALVNELGNYFCRYF